MNDYSLRVQQITSGVFNQEGSATRREQGRLT